MINEISFTCVCVYIYMKEKMKNNAFKEIKLIIYYLSSSHKIRNKVWIIIKEIPSHTLSVT